MGALSRKTVLLVTHQVDFLPTFDSILVNPFIISFLFLLSIQEVYFEVNIFFLSLVYFEVNIFLYKHFY